MTAAMRGRFSIASIDRRMPAPLFIPGREAEPCHSFVDPLEDRTRHTLCAIDMDEVFGNT